MTTIDHMMKLYEEGLDELMGAQKYAKMSHKTENSDEKATYKNMARQELDHAKMIIQMGDRDFMGRTQWILSIWSGSPSVSICSTGTGIL
jgi:hypothetical protein